MLLQELTSTSSPLRQVQTHKYKCDTDTGRVILRKKESKKGRSLEVYERKLTAVSNTYTHEPIPKESAIYTPFPNSPDGKVSFSTA